MNSNENENTEPETEENPTTQTPRVPFMQRASPLEGQLLALLRQPSYRPSKAKVISDQLGLTEDQAGELKGTIKRLAKRGVIRFGEKHRVLPLPPLKQGSQTTTEPGEPFLGKPENKKKEKPHVVVPRPKGKDKQRLEEREPERSPEPVRE